MRNTDIRIGLTQEEKSAILKTANKCGLSLAGFIRTTILKELNERSRIDGNRKEISS